MVANNEYVLRSPPELDRQEDTSIYFLPKETVFSSIPGKESELLKRLRRKLKRQLSFLKRRFIKPPPPRNSGDKVLLHIGCGRKNSPEFINIDAQPYAHVHVVTDNLGQLSDFEVGSVDLIYMCHVLEHIRQPLVRGVLREMNRVLKTGGVLRLSVPDFDRLIDAYRAAGNDPDAIHEQLMGGQDSDYNVHYLVFNRQTLSGLLWDAGFRSIRTWDPWNCEYHDFKDKATKVMKIGDQSIAISLNVEAIK